MTLILSLLFMFNIINKTEKINQINLSTLLIKSKYFNI